MRCPICDSDNYDFVDVSDFDEIDATLHFQCLGKCGKHFFVNYGFFEFRDEEGNSIYGDY